MSIYDKASLVLIPSGSKTSKVYSQVPTNGDGDFTFSRSTAATRVNASGNIEKETQNLLTYSGDLTNADWSIINSATYNGTITDPNGGNKAYSYTGGSTNSALRQTNSLSGGVYTFSVYLKSPTSAPINIRLDSNNGTFENYPCALTTDWQRFEFFYVHNSASLSAWIGGGLSWTTGEEVHIAFPQLEQGLVARDYIETTTTAIYGGITDNVPRLDYTDSSCPALLLEPQRTNLITQSEYGAGASLSNMTATSNATTSPEGVSNATTFETGITGQCQVYQFFSSSAGNYTGSVFLKKVDFDWVYMEVGGAVGWFNIGSGTLGNGSAYGSNWTYVDHSIEDYGNGWYRCTLTGNCINAGSYTFRSLQPVSNNGGYFSNLAGGDTHWFGSQIEAGSYATSYIPTYGSAVTRAYENQDATGLSTSVFNNDDLTLFYDFDYNADGREGSTTAYRIFSGTSQLGIKGRSGSSRSVEIYSSGSFSGSIVFNNIANSSRIKVALRITNGTCELFFNGAKDTETIDVSGAAPYNWGQITMLASSSLNTSLNQCLGFPTALTDQELIDLTTL